MKTRGTVNFPVFFPLFFNHIFKLRCRKEVLQDFHPNLVNSHAPCNCLGYLCECMSECAENVCAADQLHVKGHKSGQLL